MKMGDPLGPTGLSGVPCTKREPHTHLGVFYSKSSRYAVLRGLFVPENGCRLDVVRLFGKRLSYHVVETRNLPGKKRHVKIAFKKKSGEIMPPDAKVI
mgnify:FL=1